MSKTVGCYKIRKNAKMPFMATKGSACFDVHACLLPCTIKMLKPGERFLVPLGLILDIPEGYSVRVHTRSSIASKHGVGMSVSEGIIDSDYVEEVFVPVVNNGDKVYQIRDGDRIAQIELVKNLETTFEEIENAPQQKSERDGGFGSTGVN